MVDSPNPTMLAPPAVVALKEEAVGTKDTAYRGTMERTVSMDIREEREDLKRAAEQSLNAIMDLNLDGTIRWASPSWKDLSGTDPESIVGKTMSDIIVDHKNIFTDAIALMKNDDTKSRIIRFAIAYQLPVGVSPEVTIESPHAEPVAFDTHPEGQVSHQHLVNLEAQGIMVYERATGEESHTMWMIKPAVHREITIDLPDVLAESLGIGAHVLAQYLTHLAEIGSDDPADHPPPPPVLCRICERQITPWWFEKHTELCMQEHKAEMDVQIAQENLTEHRAAIVKVLDALEAQTRHSRPGPSDSVSSLPTPLCDYKGHPIGPASQPSSGPSSGRASPAGPQLKPRSSSRSGLNHQRARSFAVRRPLARVVELILDLCDTALEISPPAVKDSSQDGEIRTQSPQSEGRISQVLQWQPPNTSTVDNEIGLALLAEDTSGFCKAKVEAIFRHRRILEYSERLRIEFHILVQECIDEAVAKAARIANGELSDSSESSSSLDVDNDEDDENEDQDKFSQIGDAMSDIDGPPSRLPEGMQEDFSINPYGSPLAPSAMTMALRNIPEASTYRRASSTGDSSRSNSPHGARTPRSYGSALSTLIHQKRAAMLAP
ncbi:hypothetical protein KCU72_g10991, partial [Aureobasidium melanogenum]